MLFDLFITFAKVGVMTFGGGYAMLPILQREIVENKSWATEEDLADYYAIGQCTPGIIAINTASIVNTPRRTFFLSSAAFMVSRNAARTYHGNTPSKISPRK